MKKQNFITTIAAIAALLFIAPSVSTAQIKDFKNWLKAPKGELHEQKFASKKLSKNDCNEVAYIIDSLWLDKSAEELGHQWNRMTISHDSIKLACACRVFGNEIGRAHV